eukprot:CAMPEP_0197072152 /NCGR_PEP_ID=MMETSP1384-20130603/209955_1 /TAXON_ID=29189 /ORGANISM="Ammonia sp." /LENGTH=273 /DNA_ID=CAMNT_0042510967 /DNA_START=93 /DNA_END=914 /DNA_ORIENTATION=+
MPPKNANKKKKSGDDKKEKKLPDYLFKFRTPSRRLGSGGVLRKTSALGRLVKWPKYVQLQRQRKILLQRLKIPPALNIFNNACSRDYAGKLVKFCKNYSPESRAQKKNRLRAMAKLQAEGKPIPSEKKNTIKCGFNHVTNLIESGRAKLVLIAHDVDPIELVLWMPALCVKKDIPFVIVKSKARLGALVHKKSASCLAICEVDSGDAADLKALQTKARQVFNQRYNDLKKQWGKRTLGIKTRHKTEKRKRERKEEAQRRRAAQKVQDAAKHRT